MHPEHRHRVSTRAHVSTPNRQTDWKLKSQLDWCQPQRPMQIKSKVGEEAPASRRKCCVKGRAQSPCEMHEVECAEASEVSTVPDNGQTPSALSSDLSLHYVMPLRVTSQRAEVWQIFERTSVRSCCAYLIKPGRNMSWPFYLKNKKSIHILCIFFTPSNPFSLPWQKYNNNNYI